MKSESIGTDISGVEVLNVSPHGFWLMVRERKYFLELVGLGMARAAGLSVTAVPPQ